MRSSIAEANSPRSAESGPLRPKPSVALMGSVAILLEHLSTCPTCVDCGIGYCAAADALITVVRHDEGRLEASLYAL
jgi:hypothetical protein